MLLLCLSWSLRLAYGGRFATIKSLYRFLELTMTLLIRSWDMSFTWMPMTWSFSSSRDYFFGIAFLSSSGLHWECRCLILSLPTMAPTRRNVPMTFFLLNLLAIYFLIYKSSYIIYFLDLFASIFLVNSPLRIYSKSTSFKLPSKDLSSFLACDNSSSPYFLAAAALVYFFRASYNSATLSSEVFSTISSFSLVLNMLQ